MKNISRLAQVLSLSFFFLASASFCFAADVGCGRDTDRNGSVDAMCGGADADFDGYTITQGDCDDASADMFPGITTTTGCGTGQYKTCALDGSGYTSCSTIATSTCSSGSGSTYWVDCDAASDGTGTFASPYQDFKHLTYYYYTTTPPAGHHSVTAGDCIRVKGTCDVKTDTGVQYGEAVMSLRNNTDGTAETPIVITRWPGATTALIGATDQKDGLYIEGTNYVYVSQLKFSSTSTNDGNGLRFTELVGQRVYGNEFTAISGNCNENTAAINVAGTDAIVRNNKIWDLHGSSTGNAANCTGIAGWKGDGNVVAYNTIGEVSADASAYGIKWKHGEKDTTTYDLEIEGNLIYGVPIGIAAAQPNTTVEGNFISIGTGDYCVGFTDLGGDNALINETIRYNTCLAGASGYFFYGLPNATYVQSANWDITHNVFVSTKATGVTGENAVIAIAWYADNTEYANFIGADALTVSNNCYYQANAQTLQWSVYGRNTTYNLGEDSNFVTWQAENRAGGNDRWAMDANSYVENPSIVAGAATSTNCALRGVQFGGTPGGGETIPSPSSYKSSVGESIRVKGKATKISLVAYDATTQAVVTTDAGFTCSICPYSDTVGIEACPDTTSAPTAITAIDGGYELTLTAAETLTDYAYIQCNGNDGILPVAITLNTVESIRSPRGFAQAGSTSGNIVLASTESFATSAPNGSVSVCIVIGTGEMQCRAITAYNSSTKTATVSPDWEVTPTTSSGYMLVSNSAPAVWAATSRSVTQVSGNVTGSVASVSGACATVTDKTGYSAACSLGTDAITAASISTAAGNKLADMTLRRSSANVEASSYGDVLDRKSLLGAVGQQTHKVVVVGDTMTVYKSDGVTVLGTRTLTSNSAAAPITGLGN